MIGGKKKTRAAKPAARFIFSYKSFLLLSHSHANLRLACTVSEAHMEYHFRCPPEQEYI
jgi:hypothetical protein